MDNDLLFKFKEHLKVLNRSQSTIDAYADHVKEFLSCHFEKDIKHITKAKIESHIASLYDHKTRDGAFYKTSTICIKVRSIKRFFEFLEKDNIIFIDPAARISEPKIAKSPIKIALTEKEVQAILDQPNLSTWAGIRDRTILELFYSTGIRLNELCHLTIYDADICGFMLRVNMGKGAKDRVVPIGKHAVRFLKEYVTRVRPKFTKKNKSLRNLFADIHGNAISHQIVSIMIRRYAKAAKIKKRVCAHLFRHTFATVLIKNGADVVAVQKMMGHANLSTTQCYIRSLGLDIKAIHQKTHPREHDKE